jgi:hypothetical protein
MPSGIFPLLAWYYTLIPTPSTHVAYSTGSGNWMNNNRRESLHSWFGCGFERFTFSGIGLRFSFFLLSTVYLSYHFFYYIRSFLVSSSSLSPSLSRSVLASDYSFFLYPTGTILDLLWQLPPTRQFRRLSPAAIPTPVTSWHHQQFLPPPWPHTWPTDHPTNDPQTTPQMTHRPPQPLIHDQKWQKMIDKQIRSISVSMTSYPTHKCAL